MIYVVEAEGAERIKIGYSEAPERRLSALRTNSPNKLRLLAVYEGDRAVEVSLHWYFSDYRINGEWFEIAAEEVEEALDSFAVINGAARVREGKRPLKGTRKIKKIPSENSEKKVDRRPHREWIPPEPTEKVTVKIPCPRCGGTGCVDQEDPIEQRRARLIELAREWGKEHNDQPPTVREWKNVRGTRWPSYLTCIRAFGSWDKFILACGWEPRGIGRPIK